MVWRLEFELKREVLTQKGLSKLYQVLDHLDGLWSYATTEWLRLTLPSEDDKTRSAVADSSVVGIPVFRRLGRQGRATGQAFQPHPQPQG